MVRTFLLPLFSCCLPLSNAFYWFQAIILTLSSTFLSFLVRSGIFWSHLAFLESIYLLAFYHFKRFVPKPFRIKENLFTSVDLG